MLRAGLRGDVVNLSQIQADQNLVTIGQIPNEPFHRSRQFFDQSRYGDNLFASSDAWLLIDINDFEFVTTGQIVFANCTNVSDGLARSNRVARNIKPEDEVYLPVGVFNQFFEFWGAINNPVRWWCFTIRFFDGHILSPSMLLGGQKFRATPFR